MPVVIGLAAGIGLIILFSSLPSLTWVTFHPLQCKIYPWEAQWIDLHNGTMEDYPRDIYGEMQVIKRYYEGNGIRIYQIKYDANDSDIACEACSCAGGATKHFRVSPFDAEEIKHDLASNTVVLGR